MSTLNVSNITNGTDTVSTETVTKGTAKAWVRFTLSGGTPIIDGDFNVSSLTDHGAGDISVNFTSNMANANYAAVSTADIGFSNVNIPHIETRSTSSVRLNFFRVTNTTGGGITVDPAAANVAIFGD